MTLKKSGVKKRKKTAVKDTVEVPKTLDVSGIPPLPLLREAFICAVDEPRRWGRLGMAMQALPRYARIAALLCQGEKCFFCGDKQVPTPKEKLFMFHPEYPLCVCLSPFRKMAFDYIQNWDTVEGKKSLMAQVAAGQIALNTPVYQYFCQCGEGPVIVDVRTVTFGLRTHKKHSRRRQCNMCYQKFASKRGLSAPIAAMISAPKEGPAAKPSKHKQKQIKTNKGPAEGSLPQMEALKKEREAPAA
jgi:hypothetical protein